MYRNGIEKQVSFQIVELQRRGKLSSTKARVHERFRTFQSLLV